VNGNASKLKQKMPATPSSVGDIELFSEKIFKRKKPLSKKKDGA